MGFLVGRFVGRLVGCFVGGRVGCSVKNLTNKQ